MEPNEMNPKQAPAQQPTGQEPAGAAKQANSNDDLRSEGIDIVGTSMALDNEFSKPESEPTRQTPERPAPSPEDRLVSPDMPLPVEPVKETPAGTETVAPKTPPIRPVPDVPSIKTSPAQTTDAVPSTPLVSPSEQSAKPIATKAKPEAAKPEIQKPSAQNDPSIKPIRTFKSDAEEAVRYSNVSKIDIALAEQKKKERQGIEKNTGRHSSPGIYIIWILVVVVLLCGGWYYWFSTTQGMKNSSSQPTVSVDALVPYTKGSVVTITPSNGSLATIATKLSASSAGVGNVFAVVPLMSATSTSQAPVTALLSGTNIPNALLRSLSDQYMVGSYQYDVESPFVILKDTYFQNAFAGMLGWETNMAVDFLPFIQATYPNETESDIATSTFSDAVISNVDARLLKDASGATVLAYAFADQNTIVITTSEDALKYLLDRILQVRTIQ